MLNNLNLQVAVVGKTNFDLNCIKMDASVKIVGKMTMKGEVAEMNIENKGVGNLNAFDLIVQKLNVKNYGVGNIGITAEKEIEIESKGIGSVFYKGNAKVKSLKSKGLGS